MPQGTFVPSHCSSFYPQTKGIILYLNTFHTTIGCFLQTYFHSKVDNRFIVCAPHWRLSCAKNSLLWFFLFIFAESVLIWKLCPCIEILGPVSDVEEWKAAVIKGEKGSQDFWRVWRVFRAPWREKRERAGRGHKIQLLDCAVLTLFFFMCLSFEIFGDLRAVALSNAELNTGSFSGGRLLTPTAASVWGQTMRQGLILPLSVKTAFPS